MLDDVEADVSWRDLFPGPLDIDQHLGGKGSGVLNQLLSVFGADTEDGLRDSAFETGDYLILEQKICLGGHKYLGMKVLKRQSPQSFGGLETGREGFAWRAESAPRGAACPGVCAGEPPGKQNPQNVESDSKPS